jgi:hypothetical protein
MEEDYYSLNSILADTHVWEQRGPAPETQELIYSVPQPEINMHIQP